MYFLPAISEILWRGTAVHGVYECILFCQILSGHEGPISSLAFPVTGHVILASGSWDKSVKLWDIFTSKASKETIRLNSDGMFLKSGIKNNCKSLDNNFNKGRIEVDV